jgi:hypothetical protein
MLAYPLAYDTNQSLNRVSAVRLRPGPYLIFRFQIESQIHLASSPNKHIMYVIWKLGQFGMRVTGCHAGPTIRQHPHSSLSAKLLFGRKLAHRFSVLTNVFQPLQQALL